METNENVIETPVVETPAVETQPVLPVVEEPTPSVAPEEPSQAVEEDVLTTLIRMALTGYELPDILAAYGHVAGWDGEVVKSAVATYGYDFGQFLMDEKLIDSEVEKKFLNYTMHYHIVDSLEHLGKIDFCKSYDEFKEWIVTWAETKNYQSVLDALSTIGGKEVVIATSIEELSSVDTTKALIAEGIAFAGDKKVKTVTADSIVLKNASIESKSKKTTITLKSNGDTTLEGLTVEGEFPSNSLPQLIIRSENDETPGIVSIKNSKLSGQAGWNNTIYVGDILEGTNFKEINIENVDFSEAKGNTALSFYGWADGAVINIKNCHFGDFSNPLSFLNAMNASCTVNIENCVFDKWQLDYPDFIGVNEEYGYDYAYTYTGMILLEDHLSGSTEAEMENKKFAKMTINMTNCSGPNGKIVAPKKLSDICGCMSDKQMIYVCYTNTKPYKDVNGKGVSNLGYAGYEDHFPTINIA
jgi:hypothetical protein